MSDGARELPFPGRSARAARVRVAPGDRAAIGPVNAAICRLLGLAAGGQAPHVLTTLARHRRLFRPWLRFAGRLMPFGTLERAHAELVILRVALLCGSDYEWRQHVRLARRAGLSDDEIARVARGPDADGWSAEQRALLRAADELVRDRTIADATWAELCARFDERRRIELCLLAGHYAMLAGALNALGVAPEGGGGPG